MTGLPSQVEQVIMVSAQIAHAVLVTYIRDVDLYIIFQAMDVVQVTAVFGDHAAHYRYLCTQVNQLTGQVGTDEAQSSVMVFFTLKSGFTFIDGIPDLINPKKYLYQLSFRQRDEVETCPTWNSARGSSSSFSTTKVEIRFH